MWPQSVHSCDKTWLEGAKPRPDQAELIAFEIFGRYIHCAFHSVFAGLTKNTFTSTHCRCIMAVPNSSVKHSSETMLTYGSCSIFRNHGQGLFALHVRGQHWPTCVPCGHHWVNSSHSCSTYTHHAGAHLERGGSHTCPRKASIPDCIASGRYRTCGRVCMQRLNSSNHVHCTRQ